MGKIIVCVDGSEFERVSRWIKLDYVEVTRKHALACYAEFDNDTDHKGYLHGFRYKNQLLAVESFYGLGCLFLGGHPYEYLSKGQSRYITNVDMDGDMFNPLYAEYDEHYENVRLYRKVK